MGSERGIMKIRSRREGIRIISGVKSWGFDSSEGSAKDSREYGRGGREVKKLLYLFWPLEKGRGLDSLTLKHLEFSLHSLLYIPIPQFERL
jgi:hypothetical protein